MSTALLANVWKGRLRQLRPLELLVWVIMANHADKHGRCLMGLGRIATETRMARSTVQRIMPSLIAQGFVKAVEGSTTKHGTVYSVHAPIKPNPRPGDCTDGGYAEEEADRTDSGYTDGEYTDAGYTDSERKVYRPSVPKPYEPGSAPSLGGEGALPSNGTRAKLDPRTSYPPPDRRAKDWEVKAPRFFTHEITRRTLVMLDAGESLEAIEAERHSLVAEAVNGVPKIGQRPLPDYIPPPWPEEAAANATP